MDFVWMVSQHFHGGRRCGRSWQSVVKLSAPFHPKPRDVAGFFAPGSRTPRQEAAGGHGACRSGRSGRIPDFLCASGSSVPHTSATSIFVPSAFLSTCCRSCFTLPTLMQPPPVYLRLVQPGQAGLRPLHTSTVRRIRAFACQTRVARQSLPSKRRHYIGLNPGSLTCDFCNRTITIMCLRRPVKRGCTLT